ncbi:MAG: ABC transporter permease [Bacillota bacterium]
MRQALSIAWCVFLRMARDHRALALLLVMPLVLIGILGAALGRMFGPRPLDPFRVALVVEDQEAGGFSLGRVLAEEVLTAPEVREWLEPVPVADAEVARQEVKSGRAAAAIRVPADFTRAILAGGRSEVEVWTDPGRPLPGEIAAAVVRQFVDGVTAAPGPMPRVEIQPAGLRPVRALDYYAAAMAAMFLVMGGLARGADLVRERQEGTLARVLLTPAPRWAIPAGQILGTFAILLAQFAVLYLGTRWLYGVRWGPAAGVLLLGVAFSLAAAGLGVLAATLFRDPRAADGSVGLIGNLFAMLSGGMVPLYLFPDSLRAVSRLVPNYWALTGFLDLMGGLGVQAALRPALVLAGVGVACGALGAWRLQARPELFR